ncbi:YidB family protein [Erwinia amylovora]|uniref:YidB family protein n=1 Tax=Erwinia amylovora TaxID=552 RepID=UPI000C06DC89|nr:YidB family protein [Erwinia amylovora]
MGLLDDMINNALGGGDKEQHAGNESGVGGKSGSLAVMAILQWVQSQGGFQAVLARLQQCGVGGLAESWLGNGENQPVAVSQLQSAFGHGALQSLADQLGTTPEDAVSKLQQILPQFIDHASPDGQLKPEAEQSLNNADGNDLGKFVDGIFAKK